MPAGYRLRVDSVVVATQRGEHGKERDEIELSMVADCHVQRSGAAVADLCTIDGFNKYFALRPVPSYRQRDAGTIFLIPTLSGICLS